MALGRLTMKGARARPVVVPLKRPVVSKVGSFQDWPLILIDLYTNEGVVGRSNVEPYLKQSFRYIVPAIEDLAEAAKGQPVAPFDVCRRGGRLAPPRRPGRRDPDRGVGPRHGRVGCLG